MEILKASCILLVEQRSKTDQDRLKVVYRNAVEDVNNSGRMVRQDQTISDHQQSWGYEEGPWKGPEPRSAGDR